MRLAFRTAWPPALAILGTLPVLARPRRDRARATRRAGGAVPAALGVVALFVAGVRLGAAARRDRRVVPAADGAGQCRSAERRRAVLAADGATKAYADLVALAPARPCACRAGQSVALVGHNGSGKSTFLALAAGLLELTDGEITVARRAGRLVAGARRGELPARRAGALRRPLRARAPRLRRRAARRADRRGRPRRAARAARARATAPTTCPPASAAACARSTSIALGLVRPFELLLVDEPFVGLDASGKAALLDDPRRAPRRRRRPRRRHPRPDLRRARRPLHRPARRRGHPRRPRHARPRSSSSSG